MARSIKLPRHGNYDYYELPNYLQRLIDACEALHEASDALDSAERDLRLLEDSADRTDREAWRWAQAQSIKGWTLYWDAQEHTELAYLAWRAEREEEERTPAADLAQGE